MTTFRETTRQICHFSSTFWILIFATFMNQLGNMAFVFLVLYMTHQGFSVSQASAAFAVFAGSMLTSGLSAGKFIQKFGAAQMIMLPLAINGLVLTSFPFIHDYHHILWMCLLWGLAYGFVRPSMQTLLSFLSTQGMHKLSFSIFRLALNLGMSIGPAVGGYLALHSFDAIFFVNGAANLLASIILLQGFWKSPWFRYRPTVYAREKLSLFSLPKNFSLLLFVVGMLPVTMIFYQHSSTLSIFLSNQLHLPINFYGLLFTFNTLLIVFFELPLNILTLRWKYRSSFVLGSILLTTGMAGFYFASLPIHVLMLTMIWTVGEMMLFPAASSYMADLASEAERGTYMSIYASTSNLALLAGPWAGALVMEKLGASSLWIFCGLIGVVSIVTFWYLQEPKRLDGTLAISPNENQKTIDIS